MLTTRLLLISSPGLLNKVLGFKVFNYIFLINYYFYTDDW